MEETPLPPPGPIDDQQTPLLGPDKDKDDVRDDIAAYIQKSYRDENVRAAFMQLARAYRMSLQAQNANEVAATAIALRDGVQCIHSLEALDAHQAIAQLRSQYFDTYERIEVFIKFNAKLSGTVMRLSSAAERQHSCSKG